MNFLTALSELDRIHESSERARIARSARLRERMLRESEEEITTNNSINVESVEDDEEIEIVDDSQLVLECNSCGGIIIKDEADVETDDSDVANADEECQYCEKAKGYKVIGTFAPYSSTETDSDKDKVDIEVEDDEALDEGIFDKFKKKSSEPQKEEPKEEPKEQAPEAPKEEKFTTYTYDEWIQCLEYAHKYWEEGPETGKMKLYNKAMEIAACENLYKDVLAYMTDWMKSSGHNNFNHKSYAKHLKEDIDGQEELNELFGFGKKKKKAKDSGKAGNAGSNKVERDVTFKIYNPNGTLKYSETFTEIPGKMTAEQQFKEVFKSSRVYSEYRSNNPSDWQYERVSVPEDKAFDTKYRDKPARNHFVSRDLGV